MPETFGARLRHRREEQHIALSTIAEQTKIKVSLLEALERDDVSRWPTGIFRRAYVRAYAQAIRLDPDVVVREFVTVHPDPAEVIETAMEAVAERTRGGSSNRFRSLVGTAIDSLSRSKRPAAPPEPPRGSVEPPRADLGPPLTLEPPRFDVEPADVQRPPEPAPSVPDFLAVAELCTELGRAEDTSALYPLLRKAGRMLNATGLIVWLWDEIAAELRPALAHGYSDTVLAHLPSVGRDANNATAAAFRSGETCAVKGTEHTSGALAIPVLTPARCAGVLAIELANGEEQSRSVRAAATIFAAMFAQLIGGPADASMAQPSVEHPAHAWSHALRPVI